MLPTGFCKAGNPLAIVQETGGENKIKKLLKLLKNPQLLKTKVWRWIRDRKRYAGGKEAQFFFGNGSPELDRSDLLVNVPHINHQDVIDPCRSSAT